MEKEFVPYNFALELKELGFDEPCFGYYLNEKLNIFHSTSVKDRINSKTKDIFSSDVIVTPTFSQAFRWFREKCGLSGCILFKMRNNKRVSFYIINELDNRLIQSKFFKSKLGKIYTSYEEAELECLKKLIEIVKENGKINI